MTAAKHPDTIPRDCPAAVLPRERSDAGEVSAQPTEGAPPDPKSDAWRAARAVHDDLVADHDTPRGLAEQAYARRARVGALQAGLRALTALVQRLVLLMALALDLDPPPLRPRQPPLLPRRLRRVGVRVTFLKWPETWCVSLRGLFAGAPHPVEARRVVPKDEERPAGPAPSTPVRAEHRPPPVVLPLWGSACRLEALRRLIAEPERAARRLAFRLARLRVRSPGSPMRVPGLDRWRPSACGDAIPYLAMRFIPEVQALCLAALARGPAPRHLEPG